MPNQHTYPDSVTRFWAKVDTSAGPDACWPWTGEINNGGYGNFKIGGRKLYAHRVGYELLVGPIPAGLHIDHLCRNRRCQNARHMEPVTNAENARRGEAGINHRSKTHCPQGHPYDEANTYVEPRGGGRGSRKCRACRNHVKRVGRQNKRMKVEGAAAPAPRAHEENT